MNSLKRFVTINVEVYQEFMLQRALKNELNKALAERKNQYAKDIVDLLCLINKAEKDFELETMKIIESNSKEFDGSAELNRIADSIS